MSTKALLFLALVKILHREYMKRRINKERYLHEYKLLVKEFGMMKVE